MCSTVPTEYASDAAEKEDVATGEREKGNADSFMEDTAGAIAGDLPAAIVENRLAT